MPSRAVRLALFPLAVLLAGCGDEAEPAASAARVPDALGRDAPAWDTIAPDRLYGATTVENVRLTPVDLRLPTLPAGIDSLRLAVLSELQLGLWEGNVEVARAAVERAVAAEPDAVLLLGDYLGEGTDVGALERVLQPLRGRAAFAVLGDRDIRSDSVRARIERTLSGLGVRVLNNETATLQVRGQEVPIGGIDPELLDEPGADQEWVIASLGRPPILLSHAPGLAPRAPEGGAPLILSGGVVCSDIEVPGTPRLSWLQNEVLPGAAVPDAERLFVVDRNVLFVTCGTGYGFLPARAVAPPEVALVTLRGRRAARTEPRDTAAADTLLQQFEAQEAAGDTAAGTG